MRAFSAGTRVQCSPAAHMLCHMRGSNRVRIRVVSVLAALPPVVTWQLAHPALCISGAGGPCLTSVAEQSGARPRRREGIHIHGQEPPAPKKSFGKPPNLKAKAVMLSGPPGIGKTSAASIITRCASPCSHSLLFLFLGAPSMHGETGVLSMHGEAGVPSMQARLGVDWVFNRRMCDACSGAHMSLRCKQGIPHSCARAGPSQRPRSCHARGSCPSQALNSPEACPLPPQRTMHAMQRLACQGGWRGTAHTHDPTAYARSTQCSRASTAAPGSWDTCRWR